MTPDSVFDPETLAYLAERDAKMEVWSSLPDDEKPFTPDLRPDLDKIQLPADWAPPTAAGTTVGTFTPPPGVKRVPRSGKSYTPGKTPINTLAFQGADPRLIQQLRSLPPGMKVPLITDAQFGPNILEMMGFRCRPTDFYGGLLTDNTGQVYYPDGSPAGPELGQRIKGSIVQGRAISDATGQVSDVFLHIQVETAANRDATYDRVLHGWTDAMLGIGHFIWRGEEYEVNNLYTYAVGPDDLFYYAENEGCFNGNSHVLKIF